MSPTSIVLVHAHALFREGLRHNLASLSDFRIVGEASNGQQAIQLVDYTDPTIVLMEVDLPGVNGLEVARAIKRTHPHIGVVLLSASMDGQQVVKAIRAGVAAYQPRNVSLGEAAAHAAQVQHGDYPINELVLSLPEVAAQVLMAFRQMAVDEDTQSIYSPLSPRELQVLELVAAGPHQQGNRRTARHQQPDGQEPCLVDSSQAGGQRPHAGSRLCDAARLDQGGAAGGLAQLSVVSRRLSVSREKLWNHDGQRTTDQRIDIA